MKKLLIFIVAVLSLVGSSFAEEFNADTYTLEELHRINSLSGLKEANVYNFSYSDVSESESIPELNYNSGGSYILGGEYPVFFGLSEVGEGESGMEYYFIDEAHPAGYYSAYQGYLTATLLPDAVYEREINASWPYRMNAYEETVKELFEADGMLHLISSCTIPDFDYFYEIEYIVFPENGLISSMKMSFFEGRTEEPYSTANREIFYNKPYAEFSPDEVLATSGNVSEVTVILNPGETNETKLSLKLDPGVMLGYDYDSGTYCQDSECRRTQDYVEITDNAMTVYGKTF